MFLSCVPWPKKGRKAAATGGSHYRLVSETSQQVHEQDTIVQSIVAEKEEEEQPYQNLVVAHVPFLQELVQVQRNHDRRSRADGISSPPLQGEAVVTSLSDASDMSPTSDISVNSLPRNQRVMSKISTLGSANLTVFSPEASCDGSAHLTFFSSEVSSQVTPSCSCWNGVATGDLGILPVFGLTRERSSESTCTSKSSVESWDMKPAIPQKPKPPKPPVSSKPCKTKDGLYRRRPPAVPLTKAGSKISLAGVTEPPPRPPPPTGITVNSGCMEGGAPVRPPPPSADAYASAVNFPSPGSSPCHTPPKYHPLRKAFTSSSQRSVKAMVSAVQQKQSEPLPSPPLYRRSSPDKVSPLHSASSSTSLSGQAPLRDLLLRFEASSAPGSRKPLSLDNKKPRQQEKPLVSSSRSPSNVSLETTQTPPETVRPPLPETVRPPPPPAPPKPSISQSTSPSSEETDKIINEQEFSPETVRPPPPPAPPKRSISHSTSLSSEEADRNIDDEPLPLETVRPPPPETVRPLPPTPPKPNIPQFTSPSTEEIDSLVDEPLYGEVENQPSPITFRKAIKRERVVAASLSDQRDDRKKPSYSISSVVHSLRHANRFADSARAKESQSIPCSKAESFATVGQATPDNLALVGSLTRLPSDEIKSGEGSHMFGGFTKRLSNSIKSFGSLESNTVFYSGNCKLDSPTKSDSMSCSAPGDSVLECEDSIVLPSEISCDSDGHAAPMHRLVRHNQGPRLHGSGKRRKLSGTRYSKVARTDSGSAQSTRRGVELPRPPSLDDEFEAHNSNATYVFQEEEDMYKTAESCQALLRSANRNESLNVSAECASESDLEENEYDMLADSPASYPSQGPVVSKFPTMNTMEMRTLWRDLPAVKSAGYLDRLSSSEVKLQEAIYELLSSEESYNKSLSTLVDFFMVKFRRQDDGRPICSVEDQETIFCNAEELLEVSNAFLADLRARSEEIVVECISDIIMQHMRSFELYICYCRAQCPQNAKVLSLSSDPSFVQALRQLEQAPDAHKLSFHSYLLLPMQRITRLPLLLKAIVERTPNTSDEWQCVTKAMQNAQQLVKRCNEGARSVEMMLELESKVRFDRVTPTEIMCEHRILQHTGLIRRHECGKRKKKAIKMFVFNDVVMLAKLKQDKKGGEELSILDYCYTPFMIVNGPVSTGDITSSLFSIVFLENYEKKEVTYFFEAMDTKDMAKWMEALHEPMCRKEDGDTIYHRWNCPTGKALYAFSGQNDDDLTMHEGQDIQVLRRTEDGWCYGVIVGTTREGWFPMSYIADTPSEYRRCLNVRQRYHLLKAATL